MRRTNIRRAGAASRAPTRKIRPHFRRIVPGLVVIMLLLAGCADASDLRLKNYEKSIREEADWLWNNMNYARTNFQAGGDVCDSPNFNRKAITVSDSERADDPNRAYLVDLLNSAAFLVDEAHAEWDRFCRGEISASGAAGYLEDRLVPAYERMNGVLVALAPTRATPRPGST